MGFFIRGAGHPENTLVFFGPLRALSSTFQHIERKKTTVGCMLASSNCANCLVSFEIYVIRFKALNQTRCKTGPRYYAVITFLTCGYRSRELFVYGEALSNSALTRKSNSFDDNYPPKIVNRGETKTQFVSNVFDVVVRWYSRFRDTFAIRRAGSCQHSEGAFELGEVRSKTDRGLITVPDDICLRISICPTTQ